ncbi:YaaL family protein [Salinibacillus xinjiangensis]|uniref:DUF2508 family protein n=1 Tax=Salinibacillus xinjiangensis TaxID=1229268 RepID=A0A6G1XA78_9BACI|nr:YaaL family protein [Salinibacillus xinjiangensis]MRG87921.1 DUF2508 family protein [Salinibacillus xinjiangensis]
MFRKKRVKKKELDKELIYKIGVLKNEWNTMSDLLKNRIDLSDQADVEQSCLKGKYFFLLKEARYRQVKGMH